MSIIFQHTKRHAEAILAESTRSVPARAAGCGCVVSAVQYRLQPFENLRAYIDDIESRYQAACALGAGLIVFPELFGITPLSASAPTRQLFRDKPGASSEEPCSNQPCDISGLRVAEQPYSFRARLIRHLLPLISGACEITDTVLSFFSRKYGMLTASGSSPEIKHGKLYNTQTLYGADGLVIGQQAKINPMESELALGICYGEEIYAFDTAIGKIAIPVCMDASYPENFRMFYDMGVQFVALGTFNLEEYDPYLALRGIRPRVSEYPMIGVKAAMTGYAAGSLATGRAEIVAPCDITPHGLIKDSEFPVGNSLVSAEVYPSRLNIRNAYRRNFYVPALRALAAQTYAKETLSPEPRL